MLFPLSKKRFVSNAEFQRQAIKGKKKKKAVLLIKKAFSYLTKGLISEQTKKIAIFRGGIHRYTTV